MNPAALSLLTFLLIAVSAGGLLLGAFWPRLTSDALVKKRMALALGAPVAPAERQAVEERSRKQSVEKTFRELEEKQKARAGNRARPTLVSRMRQGGLGWSRATYWTLSLAAGLAAWLLALGGFGLGPLTAAGFGVAGGLLAPHLYVNARRNSRFRKFTAEFPNALDVIVRGVKSGLPLIDCMKVIASEGQEPVRSEFRTIVEDQTLGMPMDEAVERMAERVPLTEASFFAIVIAIQSRTGGSLSGALGNLANVLREQKKMRAKIRAMSAEAKASGGIIAALPVMVTVLVYFTSPDYISLLFTTLAGNLVLAGSGLWMLIGVLVMRKMIRFDF